MRALLRKELRSALPLLALVLFFASMDWVFLLLTENPHQFPLSKALNAENRTETQVSTFIVAIALALGLLVRERDEGTLTFLDGLPVSRSKIFLAKVAVALGVLWLLPLADFLFNVTVHALSHTSLNAKMPWRLLLTAAALDSAACVIYLFLGLALSFLRRFALLVLGLLFWAWVLLREMEAPLAQWCNILSLGDPVFAGQRWLVPWPKLGVQLALAVLCAGIAFVAFRLTGDYAQRLVERATRGRSAWLAGLTTALIIAVWIGLMGYWSAHSEDTSRPRVRYASWSVARANTAHYQFLYPENRGTFVGELVQRADAVEAKVREFLDAPLLGRVVVDMVGQSRRHAGQAYWKKVHLNLPVGTTSADADELLAVLGHETTHVYIDHLSASRLGEQFESTRFFHEGLASYVEYHLFRPAERLLPLRREAAVVRARDEVKLEELFDDAQLTLKRDRDLVYPLGEVFATALVKRHGATAPGKVLKAFGRTNAPKDLKGFALWQDTFQACGYNLPDVTDEFFAELDRAVTEHRAFIDSLPRLRGTVTQSGGLIVVKASHDGRAPGQIVCRFRPRGDTEDRFYEVGYADAGNAVRTSRARYVDRSFWYQLGWVVKDASQPIYGEWVEVRRQD